ncbi:MAG TPA: DUF92 domain-containing protein [Gemmatimonadaceae bacterium]|nr:DUF92 domain-containing protein [Gemmatimonadaceae bacterium]
MLTRALLGLALALFVSLGARRAGALTVSGAVAATVVGTLSVLAGWSWAVVVIGYFAVSSALSHLGRAAKERRISSIVAKHGARDAWQVVSNGGVFAASALAMRIHPDARWFVLGAGSLAASSADTWATEIGTLYGGAPRSILTWRRVPVGTSGGVSAIGSLGGITGSAFVALLLLALGWIAPIAFWVWIGGIAGALADSVLGASVQSRRWCDVCNRGTERDVHDCGAATRPVAGARWIDNDMVNFLSGAIGGLLSVVLVSYARG